MKSYKHILVPLELSSHSLKTLDAAYSLAQQHNSELSIVHILEPIPASWVVHSSSEQIPDAIARVFGGEVVPQEDEQDIMDRLFRICSVYDIARKNLHLCMGGVKQEILHMSNKLKTDLIVIGYHHARHLNPLTHSIAQQLLAEAYCDVLTIGAKCKNSDQVAA